MAAESEQTPLPSSGLPDALSAALLTGLGVGPAPLRPDGWSPTFQGAVGSVLGMRDPDGRAYVLKRFRAGMGRQQAATEAAALQLLAGGPAPAPRLVGSGELGAVPYVLMTRLPGIRWADRRAGLREKWSRLLHRDVGRRLRGLHAVSPTGSAPGFGALLPAGPRWPTAGAAVQARWAELAARYHRVEGPPELVRRVHRLVEGSVSALADCGSPVLCHNDCVDSNLLVDRTGRPRLRGLVDWERASWGDPMADLAQTWRHATFHDPGAAAELIEAYGIDGSAQRERMEVHAALHTLDELIWIRTDRPPGWSRSAAALEDRLRSFDCG